MQRGIADTEFDSAGLDRVLPGMGRGIADKNDYASEKKSVVVVVYVPLSSRFDKVKSHAALGVF
jgi:hypothetical protein